jgi:hypothetical protein
MHIDSLNQNTGDESLASRVESVESVIPDLLLV